MDPVKGSAWWFRLLLSAAVVALLTGALGVVTHAITTTVIDEVWVGSAGFGAGIFSALPLAGRLAGRPWLLALAFALLLAVIYPITLTVAYLALFDAAIFWWLLPIFALRDAAVMFLPALVIGRVYAELLPAPDVDVDAPPRRVSGRLTAVLFGVTMLAAVTAGRFIPNDPLADRYTPEVAGVIVEERPPGEIEYTLDDGRVVAVADGTWISGSGEVQGDLLLVGTSPEPWAYSVGPAPTGTSWPPGCFTANSGEAWVRDDWIELRIRVQAQEAYLRIPKADGFNPELAHNGRLIGDGPLCLDNEGRAFDFL